MDFIVNVKIKLNEENKEQIKYLVGKLKEINAVDDLGANFVKDLSNIFEK